MQGDVQPVVGQFFVPVAQCINQLRAGTDFVGARGQRRQQAEFAPGQFQCLLIYPGPMAGQVQAQVKALARALRQAVEPDPRVTGIPSTKGSL